ncbi:amino acid ABC transporter permease, partial [Rhizobium ruizarguesonis]
ILIGAAIGLFVVFAPTSDSSFAVVPARVDVTVIRTLPILVLVLVVCCAMLKVGGRCGRGKSGGLGMAVEVGAGMDEVFSAGRMSIQ